MVKKENTRENYIIYTYLINQDIPWILDTADIPDSQYILDISDINNCPAILHVKICVYIFIA